MIENLGMQNYALKFTHTVASRYPISLR